MDCHKLRVVMRELVEKYCIILYDNFTWECEKARLKNIYSLFTNANLSQRLILSLYINHLSPLIIDNNDYPNSYGYLYIKKPTYYRRLLEIEKKNKNTIREVKASWCKYNGYKKNDLIKVVKRLEKQLWEKEIQYRQLLDKNNIQDLGLVIFE